MRISNLTSEAKDRLKRREINYLIELMEGELEALKEDLITLPKETLDELRGKAKTFQLLIKLLK